MKTSVMALIIPALACAQMTISTVERTSAEALPDVLRGGLGFEEEAKNPEKIREDFNAIIAALKRNDPDARYCRDGGYNLSPRYSYKNQKQEFIGYGGTLSFTCEFPGIDAYNALSGSVDRALAPEVRKTQGPLAWGVSAQKRETLRRKLKTQLLRKARDEAEAFSAETGLTCRPEKIAFTDGARPMPVMLRTMEASGGTESPIRADEEVTVEASVDYSCVKRVP